MATFRRSQLRSRVPRRKTVWDAGPLTTVGGQTSATVGKVLWTTAVALASDAVGTLVRTRGHILVQLDLATAAGDGFLGAIGLGIASSDAFNTAGALPGPFSDPAWPGWFWHQFFSLRGVAAQSQGADIARNAMADLRIDIDSKAMRIQKSNEVLFGMLETGSETGTAGLHFTAQTRLLYKLS